MYSSTNYYNRFDLPLGTIIPVYFARIYRKKLHTSVIQCEIALSKYNQKSLKPLDPIPTQYSRYFRSWGQETPPTGYLGLGYNTEEEAIKSIYQNDLDRFKKYYAKFEKSRRIISATHPHLFS